MPSLMAAHSLVDQKEAENGKTMPCGGDGGGRYIPCPDVIYSAAVPESDE